MDLKFTTLETNDCKVLQVLGVNTQSEWAGISSNIAPGNQINKLRLRLYIKITTPTEVFYLCEENKVNGEYIGIDLYERALRLFPSIPSEGYFTVNTINDLSKFQFNIKANELLNEEGEYVFDEDDLLPDGVYDIVYSLVGSGILEGQKNYVTSIIFVSGVVRNEVYKELANLPIETNNIDLRVNNYNETLYSYTLLRALENNMYVARTKDLLKGLKSLQKFVLTTKCLTHD